MFWKRRSRSIYFNISAHQYPFSIKWTTKIGHRDFYRVFDLKSYFVISNTSALIRHIMMSTDIDSVERIIVFMHWVLRIHNMYRLPTISTDSCLFNKFNGFAMLFWSSLPHNLPHTHLRLHILTQSEWLIYIFSPTLQFIYIFFSIRCCFTHTHTKNIIRNRKRRRKIRRP